MKKIIEVPKRELAEYYCDFSGKRFEHDIPEIEMKLSFGYGSRFDDTEIEFHFYENEFMDILNTIKNKLSNKVKAEMQSKMDENEAHLYNAIQGRDYNSCDYYSSKEAMYKYFLDIKNE